MDQADGNWMHQLQTSGGCGYLDGHFISQHTTNWMKSLIFAPVSPFRYETGMARGCKVVQRTSSIFFFLVNSGTNCAWVIFHTRRWVVKTAHIGNFLCYQPDNCTNSRVLVLQSWFLRALVVTTMASRCFRQLLFWVKLKGGLRQISLIFIAFYNCFFFKNCNSLNFQDISKNIQPTFIPIDQSSWCGKSTQNHSLQSLIEAII